MSKVLKTAGSYIKVGKNSIKTSSLSSLGFNSNTNILPYFINDIIAGEAMSVAATNNGILYSTNTSAWQPYINANNTNVLSPENHINFKNLSYLPITGISNAYFATTDNSGLYYSADGITWDNDIIDTGLTINSIIFSEEFQQYLVATNEGLYCTSAILGNTWSVLSGITDNNFISVIDNNIKSIDISGYPYFTKYVVAATSNDIFYTQELTGLTSGNLTLSAPNYFIKVLAANNLFLVVSKNGVYSTEDGITYTPLTFDYDSNQYSILYTDAIYANNMLVISTNRGILYSTNLKNIYFSDLSHEYITNVSHSIDRFFAASKTNGTFQSLDGLAWSQVGINSSNINRGNFSIVDRKLNYSGADKILNIKTIDIPNYLSIVTASPATPNLTAFTDDISLQLNLNTNKLTITDFLKVNGTNPNATKYDLIRLTDRIQTCVTNNAVTTFTTLSSINADVTISYNNYYVNINNVYNINYAYLSSSRYVLKTSNLSNEFVAPSNRDESLTNNEILFELSLSDTANIIKDRSSLAITFNNSDAKLKADVSFIDATIKQFEALNYNSSIINNPITVSYNTFSLSAPNTSAAFTYNTLQYNNLISNNIYNNLSGLDVNQPIAKLNGKLNLTFALKGIDNSYADNSFTYNPVNTLTYNEGPAYLQGSLYNFNDIVKTLNTTLLGNYDINSKDCREVINNLTYTDYVISAWLPSISAFNFTYDYYTDNLHFKTSGFSNYINSYINTISNSANVPAITTGELYFNIVPDGYKLDLLENEDTGNYFKYNGSVVQHNLALRFYETHKKMLATYNYNQQADLEIISELSVISPLDMFYDLGFNFNRDVMYLDYINITNNSNLNSENTNSIFGSLGEFKYDENNIIYMSYLKDTLHNFEVFPQSFSDYRHIGNISNEYNTYGIYNKFDNSASTVNLAIFKYNITEGLASKFYTIPVKYAEFTDGTELHYKWVAAASENKLSVGFMSLLPTNNPVLANYVSSPTNHTNGGKTYLDDIKDTLYSNTITLIDFDISNRYTLPNKETSVKYVMKNSDLGYYPQYTDVEFGINKFWENSIISNETFYKLQLYTIPTVYSIDQVYEQYNNTNYTDNAISELASVGFTGTLDEYIYLTSSIISGDNTTIPMKWFRKYDLLNGVSLETGVNLSATTLTGDSLSAYAFKTTMDADTNYYPINTEAISSRLAYSYMELDQDMTISVRYTLDNDNNVETLIFRCLNAISPLNTHDYIITDNGQYELLIYNTSTIEKTYKVFVDTKDDLQKLQFTIQRI